MVSTLKATFNGSLSSLGRFGPNFGDQATVPDVSWTPDLSLCFGLDWAFSESIGWAYVTQLFIGLKTWPFKFRVD